MDIGGVSSAGPRTVGRSSGLGFALSAVTVLPRLDFLERANLAGGSYEAVAPNVASAPGWSVGRALTNILNPADLKFYVGAATFALAIAGIALAGRSYAAPFFALFSAGILVLTMEHTPVHTFAYLLPRFEVIHEHVPARILVVFNIGPAMLTGAAVTVIHRNLASPSRIAAAAVAVFGAVAASWSITDRDDVPFNGDIGRTACPWVRSWRGQRCWALGCSVVSGGLRRGFRESSPGCLLVAVAWNLGSPTVERARDQGFGLPPIPAVPLAYADRDDAGQAGAFLVGATEWSQDATLATTPRSSTGNPGTAPTTMPLRTISRTESLLANNRAVLLHLQDAQGYNPVHSMRYVEFVDSMNGVTQEYHETNLLRTGIGSPLLDLLNVRYIVVPAKVPPGRPDLLRLSQLYPTVFVAADIRVLENGGLCRGRGSCMKRGG